MNPQHLSGFPSYLSGAGSLGSSRGPGGGAVPWDWACGSVEAWDIDWSLRRCRISVRICSCLWMAAAWLESSDSIRSTLEGGVCSSAGSTSMVQSCCHDGLAWGVWGGSRTRVSQSGKASSLPLVYWEEQFLRRPMCRRKSKLRGLGNSKAGSLYLVSVVNINKISFTAL